MLVTISALVPVLVKDGFRFRFWFKIVNHSFGLVPVSVLVPFLVQNCES